MRLHIQIVVIALFFASSYCQEYGRFQEPNTEIVEEKTATNVIPETLTPLEAAVDPGTYILGPGDEIGLNILTQEVIMLPLTVTPTGDLFIPAVGSFQVAGLTLGDAIEQVQIYIQEKAYPNAQTHMALINPRKFKLLVTGAVTDPGFVTVTPLTRLGDVISMVNGFHQFAMDYAIKLTRTSGTSETVNFHTYLLSGDLNSNPMFLEGDRVDIPFANVSDHGIVVRGSVDSPGYDIIAPHETLENYIKRGVVFTNESDLETVIISRTEGTNENQYIIRTDEFKSTELIAGDRLNFMFQKGVSVTGFVQSPGGFTYYPGYSVSDYIALAGGNSTNGNPKAVYVTHQSGKKEKGLETQILSGDVIYVPRTNKDIYLGDISVFQLLVGMTTVYLTYLSVSAN